MWGSSFADLAKKAAEQASTLSAGDLFNLDSMQGGNAPASLPSNIDTIVPIESKAPSFTIPSCIGSSSSPPPPKEKPPAPKGKLVVPSKKSPKVSSKKLLPLSFSTGCNGSPPKPEKAALTTPAVPGTNLVQTPPIVETAATEKLDSVDKYTIKEPIKPDQIPEEETVEELVVVQPHATDEERLKADTHDADPPESPSYVASPPEEKQEGYDKEILRALIDPKQCNNEQITTLESPSEAAEDATKDANEAQSGEPNMEIGPPPDEKMTFIEDLKVEGACVVVPKSDVGNVSSSNGTIVDQQSPWNTPGPVPEKVMEQFTAQMQRLQESFELERQEIQEQNRRELAVALATKESEIARVQELLKEKDKKVRELLRIKEGNELRMDSLKREVVGIKALLEEKCAEEEKLNDVTKLKEKETEKRLAAMAIDHTKTKQELKKVQDELAKAQGQLQTTNEDYNALKSRVKTVAGELKERRTECRELTSKIEELAKAKEKLEEHISTLASQLSDRDRCGTEKDEEVDQLRTTIENLERQLKQSEDKLKAQVGSFENDLATYKRKAQNALSLANARAAAATQSKEEAELEARAARSTADSMMDRARVAEAKGETAMVEAKRYCVEMEKAKAKAVAELEVATNELNTVKATLAESSEKLIRITAEKQSLAELCSRRARDLEAERSNLCVLQMDIAETNARARDLHDDAAKLRMQLQKARAAAEAKSVTVSDEIRTPTSVQAPVEDTNSRATIIMLQKQLAEANAQIDELKDLMRNALTSEKSDGVAANSTPKISPLNTNGSNANSSAPLFYAIEKQVELNTARNEINRLASLYSNLQSEKFGAQEALEAARRELDEERAKLRRYEKLNHGGPSPSTHSSAETDSNAGRTNIEYLKNIVLRYLDAKSLAEKKALIPVISAVLCLTPEEQAKAIQNVESSVGVEGFGKALFESFGSRVGR